MGPEAWQRSVFPSAVQFIPGFQDDSFRRRIVVDVVLAARRHADNAGEQMREASLLAGFLVVTYPAQRSCSLACLLPVQVLSFAVLGENSWRLLLRVPMDRAPKRSVAQRSVHSEGSARAKK